jgi:hypothetical protein
MTTITACAPRPRGRPAITLDNTAVRRVLSAWSTFTELADSLPEAEDIITGSTLLRTAGITSTRPLARSKLFHLLTHLDSISTREVASLLALDAGSSTAELYASVLRIISKAVHSKLKSSQRWQDAAAEARHTLDAQKALDQECWDRWCAAGGGMLSCPQ